MFNKSFSIRNLTKGNENMKKMLLLLGTTFFSLSMTFGQTSKTFDCGLFFFDYPSNFKPIPIQNAPHMVLKLESDSYIFTASYWDKGFDDNVSIWDDEIFDLYKQNPIGEGTLVGITRETIQTKGGAMRRCLKLKTNIYRYAQGFDINMKITTYLMIYNGYLFVFTFTSQGKYTKDSKTVYPDKIMKGLRFKSLKGNLSNFNDYLLSVVKTLNSQCPMQVDECTTHMSVLLSGKTVMIKTIIDDSCEFLVDYDEFKSKMCENFSVALEKSFVQYLDRNGYTMMYMIYNEYDRLKKKVTISGHDILNYYH